MSWSYVLSCRKADETCCSSTYSCNFLCMCYKSIASSPAKACDLSLDTLRLKALPSTTNHSNFATTVGVHSMLLCAVCHVHDLARMLAGKDGPYRGRTDEGSKLESIQYASHQYEVDRKLMFFREFQWLGN
eukprot:6490306-Amphidinium_carterae.3